MPRIATWTGNFKKTIFFIQLHGIRHGVEGLQIAVTVAVVPRCFQAFGKNLLAQAFASRIRQKIHFLKFARIGRASRQRSHTASTYHLVGFFAHKVRATWLCKRFVHMVYFMVVNGKAFATGAKFWHYGADNMCHHIGVARFNQSDQHRYLSQAEDRRFVAIFNKT